MPAARKDEITSILKEQIRRFDYDLEMKEVGVVVEEDERASLANS